MEMDLEEDLGDSCLVSWISLYSSSQITGRALSTRIGFANRLSGDFDYPALHHYF